MKIENIRMEFELLISKFASCNTITELIFYRLCGSGSPPPDGVNSRNNDVVVVSGEIAAKEVRRRQESEIRSC